MLHKFYLKKIDSKTKELTYPSYSIPFYVEVTSEVKRTKLNLYIFTKQSYSDYLSALGSTLSYYDEEGLHTTDGITIELDDLDYLTFCVTKIFETENYYILDLRNLPHITYFD